MQGPDENASEDERAVYGWLEAIGALTLVEAMDDADEPETFEEGMALVRRHPITFTSATLKQGIALGILRRG